MTSSPPVSPTPAPPRRRRRTPSITRVFTAAFLAIAIALVADRFATWQSARRTQADMLDLTHRLEQLERLHPSLGLEVQTEMVRELAADVGDNAIQLAIETSLIAAIILVALAVGLWQTRRRLAVPFAYVLTALQRVAAGEYAERLDEAQPEEFGMIARSVNRRSEERRVGKEGRSRWSPYH